MTGWDELRLWWIIAGDSVLMTVGFFAAILYLLWVFRDFFKP